ncbi:MAG: DNA mismatch repair protein MutT [Anaerolineae bacterium]|nr:MAG: DNA mismatch repair protein MutT [Anaerolineae bacterium]
MKLATLCYVKRDGKTLMIHRMKRAGDIHAGKWNGLGGKLEPGESPEQCVIREVREESGLEIIQPRYHGLLVFADFKGEDWYVWVFTAEHFHGTLTDSSEGQLAWISDEQILSLPLWPSDQVFLPWLKEDKIFSARFQYNGDEMRGWEATFY